jgi:hypothetical protein
MLQVISSTSERAINHAIKKRSHSQASLPSLEPCNLPHQGEIKYPMAQQPDAAIRDLFSPLSSADIPDAVKGYLVHLADSSNSAGAMKRHLVHLTAVAASKAAKAWQFTQNPVEEVINTFMEQGSKMICEKQPWKNHPVGSSGMRPTESLNGLDAEETCEASTSPGLETIYSACETSVSTIHSHQLSNCPSTISYTAFSRPWMHQTPPDETNQEKKLGLVSAEKDLHHLAACTANVPSSTISAPSSTVSLTKQDPLENKLTNVLVSLIMSGLAHSVATNINICPPPQPSASEDENVRELGQPKSETRYITICHVWYIYHFFTSCVVMYIYIYQGRYTCRG